MLESKASFSISNREGGIANEIIIVASSSSSSSIFSPFLESIYLSLYIIFRFVSRFYFFSLPFPSLSLFFPFFFFYQIWKIEELFSEVFKNRSTMDIPSMTRHYTVSPFLSVAFVLSNTIHLCRFSIIVAVACCLSIMCIFFIPLFFFFFLL